MKIKGIIISAFPGTGKTTAAGLMKEAVDLESTPFKFPVDWEKGIVPTEEAEDWVQKYVDQITLLASECGYNFVFVSSHQEVRKELRKREIPFISVIPQADLRDEYMIRYIGRGNDMKFLRNVYDNWFDWLHEYDNEVFDNIFDLEGKPQEIIIHLKSGQYVSDLLPLSYLQRGVKP
jgi:hypothetical protein